MKKPGNISSDSSTIAELHPDPRNARKHNPRNVGMIEAALREVGAARSIVIDEEGTILAGNATVEAAAAAGIEKVRIVETDGNEIVAVKRTGLTKKQKTRLALYDNRGAELATWDVDVLRGFDPDELDGLWHADELSDVLRLESFDDTDTGAEDEDILALDKFPLAIVLSSDERSRWLEWKAQIKIHSDKRAFIETLRLASQ